MVYLYYRALTVILLVERKFDQRKVLKACLVAEQEKKRHSAERVDISLRFVLYNLIFKPTFVSEGIRMIAKLEMIRWTAVPVMENSEIASDAVSNLIPLMWSICILLKIYVNSECYLNSQ